MVVVILTAAQVPISSRNSGGQASSAHRHVQARVQHRSCTYPHNHSSPSLRARHITAPRPESHLSETASKKAKLAGTSTYTARLLSPREQSGQRGAPAVNLAADYGNYVKVGDAIEWSVRRQFDRSHLAKSYGLAQSTAITGIYDPEVDALPTDESVRGVVTRIRSVTCRERADGRRLGFLESVPETAVYQERGVMRAEELDELADDRTWAGYVVDLAVISWDKSTFASGGL